MNQPFDFVAHFVPNSPSPPLTEARSKVSRARRHIDEMEAEVEGFIRATKVLVAHQVIDGKTFPAVKFDMPPTTAVALCLGDAIHNLRSALDLAICELVRLRGNSDKKVAFPFGKNASHFEAECVRYDIERQAGSSALNLLRELAPYQGGDEKLRAIHDMDIQDKHRQLNPHATKIGGGLWFEQTAEGLKLDPSRPGAIDAWGALLFPANTPLASSPLGPGMRELADMVAGIVERFAALAPPVSPEQRPDIAGAG